MVLPLVTTDAVSDSENIDDEEQILNDRSAFLLYEIAGHIELSCAYNEDSPNVSADCGEELENILRDVMPRDRCKLVKKYFHVCDNHKFDASDKFARDPVKHSFQ